MKIQLAIGDDRFEVDPAGGRSIAILQNFDERQPNHFGVPLATKTPVVSGDFVGSTKQGGACNVDQLNLIPHCNGTHTESVGHIVDESVPIGVSLLSSFSLATLVSVTPVSAEGCDESYSPDLRDEDQVITSEILADSIGELFRAPALIIRTLPNLQNKLDRQYSAVPANENCPPFFTNESIELLNEIGVQHLLVDVPSIDRTHDEGKLGNHHLFWNVAEGSRKLSGETFANKTITEMIFVPDQFCDGVYFLNLQLPAFACDAAPSRPVLFEMQ